MIYEILNSNRAMKIVRILLAMFGGESFNRFDAEAHHDHCLHSTVSTLEGLGIVIDRRWERVPCMSGRSTVRCKRYWLDRRPENVDAARAMLVKWRAAV